MNPKRIALFAINIIYLILTVALFILGGLIEGEYHYGHSSLLSTYAKAGATATLSFGGVILFLAIISLVGIYKEHKKTLYVSVGLLLLSIGFEIGGSITCSYMQVDALTLISRALRSAQSNYLRNSTTATTWDSIQRHVKCCGVDSYKEWYHYLHKPNVPDSCCINYAVGCGRQAVQMNNTYTTSCDEAIRKWAFGKLTPSFAIYATIVVLQVFSICIGQGYFSDLENS